MSITLSHSATIDLLAAQYKDYHGYFVNFAKRYCKNVDDAHDMVSIAFTQAFSAADKYEGRSTIRTWVTMILRNACLDSIRRSKSRPEWYSESLDTCDPKFLVKATTIERDTERAQIMARVRIAIDLLPHQERAAIGQYLQTGEVGNDSTFKVQKFRAIQHLRVYFNQSSL